MGKKIHFEHYGIAAPACGAGFGPNFCTRVKTTKVIENVTCVSCKRTWSYREAKGLEERREQA